MSRGSAEFYDLIYGQKPYEAEAEAVHGIIQRHLRSGGDALLDVGCGSGNHRVEHDPQGLTGRGLYIARRPE